MRFRTQVRINLWVTRGNDFQPFLHYDTHDIFVLQVHGGKHWTLYDRNPLLFAPRSGGVDLHRGDVGEPAHAITLQAGDMLYVPAGMPHEVTTRSAHSVHLAVSVFPVLWRDVLEDALADLDRRGGTLTDAVPQELLASGASHALHVALCDRVLQAVGDVDEQALAQGLASRLIQAVPPPQDGHFVREILGEQALDSATLLRRRGDAQAVVQIDERAEVARIRFPGGGAMDAPLALGPTLQAVAAAEAAFSAQQIHSDYDLQSRTLVLSELLQRGLLERAEFA